MTSDKTILTGGAAVVGCLFVLLIGVGVTALEAWVLQIVAGAFDWHPGYWLCFGIVFLFNVVMGALKRG